MNGPIRCGIMMRLVSSASSSSRNRKGRRSIILFSWATIIIFYFTLFFQLSIRDSLSSAHLSSPSSGGSSRATLDQLARVEKENLNHVAEAIDSLINADKITFEHSVEDDEDHQDESEALVLTPPSDSLLSGQSNSGLGQKQQMMIAAESSQSSSESPSSSTSSHPKHKIVVKQVSSQNAEKEFERLTLAASSSSSDGLHFSETEADVDLMNQTFRQIFNRPRSDLYSKRMKESAKTSIMNKFQEYKLETFTQSFTANKRGVSNKGVNIIGILPGKFRDANDPINRPDEILLLGAHYDTVESSPGIDDNGSGMVAIMEVARLLSNQPQPLNHTVIFVAFDLEELGLLGSLAFVREYLIPTELLNRKAKFLGAYVIDMVLNYDSTPGSQSLPRDIMTGVPEISRKITGEGNRGDFVAIWMRKNVDGHVYQALQNEWRKTSRSSPNSNPFKIRAFDPPLPSSSPSANELFRYGTFTRSDHASFWYHKHPSYPHTLNAILLTDMGPWRGLNKKCYHNWCDDELQLTAKNLQFLKNTVDTLTSVILKNPPKGTKEVITSPEFVPSTPSSVGIGRRGFRSGRGRSTTRIPWHTFT